MAEEKKRKMVNLNPYTASLFDGKLKRINNARARKNKAPLTNTDFVELAIENLTVQMGVER